MTYRKLLCFGSRYWKDQSVIERELKSELRDAEQARETLVVLHGDCYGADRLCDQEARRLGIHVARIPALWEVHKILAGPMRNRLMVDAFKPDRALGFHGDIEHSRGSKHCRKMLLEAGITARIVQA